jgi:hypothetical protein
VSDGNGELTVLDHDCDLLWHKNSGGSGWMVRADKDGVYHGHGNHITAYDWDAGKKLWSQKTDGGILFGWQEPTTVYAGTGNDLVVAYTKKGKFLRSYKCDDSVMSNAAAADGKYVFAGDSASSVYCFDEAGNRLWKLDTTCDSALSMQYFRDRLYIVTSNGTLACIDVSEAAIAAAKQGTLPTVAEVKMDRDIKAASIGDTLPTAAASGEGVHVECYSEGGRVRVRPTSPGFKASWHVQFPRNIRTPEHHLRGRRPDRVLERRLLPRGRTDPHRQAATASPRPRARPRAKKVREDRRQGGEQDDREEGRQGRRQGDREEGRQGRPRRRSPRPRPGRPRRRSPRRRRKSSANAPDERARERPARQAPPPLTTEASS